MADTLPRSSYWQHDLLWAYLANSSAPLPDDKVAESWLGDWYKKADKKKFGAWTDRRKVYELLVQHHSHTHPDNKQQVADSLIPWNQRQPGYILKCKQLAPASRGLGCGSLVKAFCLRYLKWKEYTPKYLLNAKHTGYDDEKIDLARRGVLQQLMAGYPVRVGLGTSPSGPIVHRVGVVACRVGQLPDGTRTCDRMLCIDPDALVNTGETIYAGTHSKFLGIINHESLQGKAGHRLRYYGRKSQRLFANTVEIA